jgi:hypothetical protein
VITLVRHSLFSDGDFSHIPHMILDTCHASEFQLREVQSGYRHSTDPARFVRQMSFYIVY